MSDIRNKCPINCIAYNCDSEVCPKYKAYMQGRTDTIDELLDITWYSIDLWDFRGEVMRLKEQKK